ncbi:2553_t:CDS:2, partial [Paraglomus brasilianum]
GLPAEMQMAILQNGQPDDLKDAVEKAQNAEVVWNMRTQIEKPALNIAVVETLETLTKKLAVMEAKLTKPVEEKKDTLSGTVKTHANIAKEKKATKEIGIGRQDELNPSSEEEDLLSARYHLFGMRRMKE